LSLFLIFTLESSYCFQPVLAIAILSVRPSVCHTGGSVKNGASYDHQIFTIGSPEDFSFRNVKLFHKFEGVTPNEGPLLILKLESSRQPTVKIW